MAVASNTIVNTTKFGEWINLLNIVINEARSVSNTIPDALITQEAVLNDPNVRDILNIGANDSPIFDNQPLTQNSYIYLSSLDQDVSSGSNVEFVDVKSTNTHVGVIEPYGFSVDGKVRLGANDYVYENGFSVGSTNFNQNGDGSFTVLAINKDNVVGGYTLSVNGSINTSANTYENNDRVYSPNNIYAGSVGLNNVLNVEQVPKSGGEFTGNVTVQDNFIADTILVDMGGVIYELVPEGFLLRRANYYGIDYDMSSVDNQPRAIEFSPNGLRMFLLGDQHDAIYQYTLSESYIVDSATYDSISFDLSGQETTWSGLAFGSSGSKMYVLSTGSDIIHQYSLSTPWDTSTLSYDNISLLITDDTLPTNLEFNNTGTKMYVAGASGNQILEYALSTPWNISTATYNLVFYALSIQPSGLAFNSDGSKMYISRNGAVQQHSLSTPFDLSTASYDNISFDTTNEAIICNHVNFDINGTRMYIVNSLSDLIHQYSTNELRLIQQ